MADSTLNAFLASGTAAERAAFTPTPPTPAAGADSGYVWYETDTDSLYAWDSVGAAWVHVGGGVSINDGDTLSTGLTFPNTGLHLLDTNASHDLILKPGSNITADRTLTLTTGDADRTFDLGANLTVTAASTINQDVSTTADPSFNSIQINDSNDSHQLQFLAGSDLSADRTLTITTGDANRTLTLPVIGTVGITIDGGGSTITTGVKGYVECPYAGTIVAATLLADQSGSIVIDVWKDTYANYPPDNADSITAAAPPTLSTATKSQDTTLTGWTTSITAGDVLGFNVDSATTVTRVTLILKINRT
jgi:hypothetical protein